MFPAALSSTPDTMEAQAQGGWSPVAPEVCSSGAQRLFLQYLTLLPDRQGHPTRTELRAHARLRDHAGILCLTQILWWGWGPGKGWGPENRVLGQQGLCPCLHYPFQQSVGHFLVLEGAQRTCCAGSGSQRRSPPPGGGREEGERGPRGSGSGAHVLLFSSAGGGEADARGGFVETQCPCCTRAAVGED